ICTPCVGTFAPKTQRPWERFLSLCSNGSHCQELFDRRVPHTYTAPPNTSAGNEQRREHLNRSKVSLHGRRPQRGGVGSGQRGLVAQSAQPKAPEPGLSTHESHGEAIRLREGIQETRSRRGDQGSPQGHDGLAGLV